MEQVDEQYKNNFHTNDESKYEEFTKMYDHYKTEEYSYKQYRFGTDSIRDYQYEWQDNSYFYDEAMDHRERRKQLGHDLTVILDEREERARWFSSVRYIITEDCEDYYYECRRSLYCGQYWCDSHHNEFYYNEHNIMYCNVAWEDMAVDEVSEDPEHEHRLFMFHSQDPGFHDVYLGVPTTTVSDYSDSDTSPMSSWGEYIRKPVISDDSDSDVTDIDGDFTQDF